MAREIELMYFKVMINFFEKWFDKSKCDCDSVATLLSGMDLNWRKGQEPFDPALWEEWLDAIKDVRQEA